MLLAQAWINVAILSMYPGINTAKFATVMLKRGQFGDARQRAITLRFVCVIFMPSHTSHCGLAYEFGHYERLSAVAS